MAVDAVIFDWGGTLTPWHTVDLREQWLAYASVYDASRADELSALLLAAEDDCWRAGREHNRSATLEGVFRSAGVEPVGERHEAAMLEYHRVWDPHTYADPDAIATMAGLHERGLRVGVLSNTLWTREHHESVFARDGLLDLIDGAVYSSEIPYTKPHPESFLSAMGAVGAEDPSRTVFVGDRPFEDIHGAKEVGMRAVLVPHSQIPDYQRGHSEGDPDGVVQRLLDLLPLVDSWR